MKSENITKLEQIAEEKLVRIMEKTIKKAKKTFTRTAEIFSRG